MPVIDFKEIIESHISSGLQDTFELFARDVLESLGYKIITQPNRGADGGKDIIVEEKRTGIGGETKVKWLVSCKHKAHSGFSVSPSVEMNIRDRVESNGCSGFIGFYSTLPSSGLNNNFNGLKDKFEIQIFDKERIEKELLSSSGGIKIAERYFPTSFKNWRNNDSEPIKMFSDNPSLKCEYCGKELLGETPSGNIVKLFKPISIDNSKTYQDIYWCCKGHCDRKLKQERCHTNLIDSWEDITDILIPHVYLKWIMALFNNLYSGQVYKKDIFNKQKIFIIALFPYISRELSKEQKKRFKTLSWLPDYLGGFGK